MNQACTLAAGVLQCRLQRPAQQRRLVLVSAAWSTRPQQLSQTGGRTLSAAGPLLPPLARRGRCLTVVQAAPGGGQGQGPNNPVTERQQRRIDQQIVVGAGVGLTLLVLLALRLGPEVGAGGDGFEYGAGSGDFALGAGDAVGAFLWTISLYFCSPLQLLVIFFGEFEKERPSDGVLRWLGQAAGQNVDAIDYQVPLGVQAATWAVFGAAGLTLAAVVEVLLGDATWSVSTGLGACVGAAMYEVGRPRRLNVEEAQAKEAVWQDFRRFADASLVRRGRCHETEILRALGRAQPRYRGERTLDGKTLRDLIKFWNPAAERSPQGFYEGVSLAPAGGPGNDRGSSSSSSSGGGGGSAASEPATGSASSIDQY